MMPFREAKCLIISDAPNWRQALPEGCITSQEFEHADLQNYNLVAIGKSVPNNDSDTVIKRAQTSNTAHIHFEDRTQVSPDEVVSDPILPFIKNRPNFAATRSEDTIQLQTLVEVITTANSILEPKEVMKSVMSQISMLVPCEAWSVLILDEQLGLKFAATSSKNEALIDLAIPVGEGIAGWVAERGKALVVNSPEQDERFFPDVDNKTDFHTKHILAAPLRSRGRVIGVIEMLNSIHPGGFSEADLELVQIFVNPVAVAIENAYLFKKTELLTIQDDLTKLFNARHLNRCFDFEIQRAKRLTQPLSVLFLDLDGFKLMNDRFGHLQGSQSLVDVGHIIKDISRETDIVGRYGGDEFMLILPSTDCEGAYKLAQRIRQGIESYEHEDQKLSASIGIATYPDCGSDKEKLFSLADHAMYWVKAHGKNGVAYATPDGFKTK